MANMVVIKEAQKGLISTFHLKCNMCHFQTQIESTEPNTLLDLNKRYVNAIISIGCGEIHADEILNNLHLPTLSHRRFNKVKNEVFDDIEENAVTEMQKAADEEKAIAIAENKVGADGVPEIMVVCDGTWPKRSYRKNYSSKSGAAAIIGFQTKKVLYLGIKNKYCMQCEIYKRNNVEPTEHRCFKNYTGPSTAMEAVILSEGFKVSEKMYGIRYTQFIGDGDSNVHKKILEAFPYRKSVEKIECRNHLLRNYRTKLEELASRSSNGPLDLRRKLKSNILRMRISIIKAIKYRKAENYVHHIKSTNLRKDLLNIPNHTFGEHQNCSSYFCSKTTPDEGNIVPRLKEFGLFEKIRQVFEFLAKNSNSLIHNVDSNLAEQFNNVICKYISGKRVNFTQRRQYQGRCHLAALTYNTKRSSYYNLYKLKYGYSPKAASIIKFEKKRNIQNYRLKKRKLNFAAPCDLKETADEHYGPNCEKPDMTPEEYERAKQEFLTSIRLTKKEIIQIEENTRQQYNSTLWLDTRKKILTASHFANICKRRPTTRCGALVKSILLDNFINSPAVQWGKDHEAKAIEELQNKLKIDVKHCGLFISEEFFFLGATPDGLIGDSGLVEIKCPWSAREMTPDEGIAEKKITVWKLQDGSPVLNTQHKWYYQIQGQLAVTNRSYCVFCVWTPLGIRTETILRDHSFWGEKMFPFLEKFYYFCYLPELVDSRLARNMTVKEPDYIMKAISEKATKK